MALECFHTGALRRALFDLLRADAPNDRTRRIAPSLLVPMKEVTLNLPAKIGSFSDFLTSRSHTERHGRYKGLKDPLPAAFFSLPVAYHGRTSSIRVSGTPVVRPRGQLRDSDGTITFGPTRALDYELEVGAFVRGGNELSHPIPLSRAREHLFGFSILNDWSAKDVQWWEQILGPFLGKSFMTSLAPWVVTMEALAPFRVASMPRPASDPALLPHLKDSHEENAGAFDIVLEAWLQSARMREAGTAPLRLTRTNLRSLYWTFGQMLFHHASNGCNLEPGDLLGSGTVSGEGIGSAGCLTEITQAGRVPLRLSAEEDRTWLKDGDEIVLRARAEREGFASIGFGHCMGRILPAHGTHPQPIFSSTTTRPPQETTKDD